MTEEISNLHTVDKNVFRSGILTNANIDALIPLGIRAIISLKTNPIDTAIESIWAKKHQVEFVNIPINVIFKSECEILSIRNAYRNVLKLPKPLIVHCTRGSDRTGIVIAMYRILEHKWNYDEAVKEMDNLGFNNMLGYWKSFLYDVYIKRVFSEKTN